MEVAPKTNKKKILYIITKSNFGGAQRYVYDLAVNLSKSKFGAVVAFGGSGKLREKLETAGVRTVQIKHLDRDVSLLNDFLVFVNIFQLIRKERSDILHLNSPKAGGLGVIAGRLYNFWNFILSPFQPATSHQPPATIIFTAHGWAFNEERPWVVKITIKIMAWLTLAFAHKTIAVSKKMSEDAPTFFIPKNKLEIIYNGTSSGTLMARVEALEALGEKLSVNKKIPTVRIGTIAELHKNKGLKYAILAMSELVKEIPGLSYTIIGEGEERKNLEKLILHHKLSKVVRLAGFVDNAQRYLQAFDIFLLPSVTEALGISILEAGSAGMPVIATSVGGMPEIIDDMKTGILVRPRQPKEIASAIKFLINNPNRAEEFGKNLSKKVSENFSLETMLEKTYALYK
ncbi:MAG: glycosyltransferase family 4 protein [Patescibacteria group bacterium]